MTARIHALKTRPALSHDKILKQVRRWLKTAEKREEKLTAVAIVSVSDNGDVGFMYEATDHPWELMGAIHTTLVDMARNTTSQDGPLKDDPEEEP